MSNVIYHVIYHAIYHDMIYSINMVYTIHGMVYITCISWYITCHIAWYIPFILMSEHVSP